MGVEAEVVGVEAEGAVDQGYSNIFPFAILLEVYILQACID